MLASRLPQLGLLLQRERIEDGFADHGDMARGGAVDFVPAGIGEGNFLAAAVGAGGAAADEPRGLHAAQQVGDAGAFPAELGGEVA